MYWYKVPTNKEKMKFDNNDQMRLQDQYKKEDRARTHSLNDPGIIITKVAEAQARKDAEMTKIAPLVGSFVVHYWPR